MSAPNWMSYALALGATRQGFTAPNPAVGAVVVNTDGDVLGKGFHAHSGADHAEIMALKQAGERAKGADLYVTLEPCSHHGKTPPCVDAILQAGISRVFYGHPDTNSTVSGEGAKKLTHGGVICEHVTSDEVNSFYRPYCFWLEHGMPWANIKVACSLDGKLAQVDGRPYPLTGEKFSTWTASQRATCDGILTTIQTVLSDDPRLNVRLPRKILVKPIYVVDSRLRLPLTAKILQTGASVTIFYRRGLSMAGEKRRQQLEKQGVTTIACDSDHRGIDLFAVFQHIGQLGCHQLWVEVGAKMLAALHQAGLIQQLYCAIAPCVLAERGLDAFVADQLWLNDAQFKGWELFDTDALCRFDFSV